MNTIRQPIPIQMKRAYYSNNVDDFLKEDANAILGKVVHQSQFAVEQSQRNAWIEQITGLKQGLVGLSGSIYLEYAIPRMGKRVDVVLLVGAAIFVTEYKVGEDHYSSNALDQVTDYALDLKNFHESHHDRFIVPILIATQAQSVPVSLQQTQHNDKLFLPVRSNGQTLDNIIREVQVRTSDASTINCCHWERGSYGYRCSSRRSVRPDPEPCLLRPDVQLLEGPRF